jgi:hypothetical protein
MPACGRECEFIAQFGWESEARSMLTLEHREKIRNRQLYRERYMIEQGKSED